MLKVGQKVRYVGRKYEDDFSHLDMFVRVRDGEKFIRSSCYYPYGNNCGDYNMFPTCKEPEEFSPTSETGKIFKIKKMWGSPTKVIFSE